MPLSDKKFRLAVLTSHPIEYQGPLFQYIAKNHAEGIDLTVYFCWDFGVKETYEPDFATRIKWDFPILEGYRHKFLKNFSPKPTSTRFSGEMNPGIILEIAKHKYDAILVLGWQVMTTWLAFFAAFLSGTPVLLRGENPLGAELRKPKWKIALKKVVLGGLFRRVGAIMYIGEENRKFYKFYGVPDSKLFFMPYAVNNERFMGDAGALRKEREGEVVTILFAGKLIEKKRPLDVLEAYQMIKGDKKALIFMGDGPLREKIERRVAECGLENVRITGFIGQTEIKHYYAAADVFVLPSDERETWGLVVNEAMCFGLPVIVSDRVGCGADLVREGENGYRFTMGDTKELARHLEELVEHREKREAFGAKSAETIRRYSYERDAAGVLEAMRALKT